ncbi:hypothetical protein DH2020_027463 [Rehmannia glutinosa]|uniref:DELLA protein n=1 Tax=Rehmannia glutinosa TaxID=99300 RepID=A0ABR0VXP8_REHGL
MAPYSSEFPQHDHLSYQVKAKKQVHENVQPPFEILNKYRSQMKRLRSGKFQEIEKTDELSSVLSALSIMRMAKLKSNYSHHKGDFLFTLTNSSDQFDSALAHKHADHLKRSLCLLDAADNFFNRKYDQAEKSLNAVLSEYSHADDHPVDRVIACFARDLRERIDIENGKIDLERELIHVDVEQELVDLKSAIHANEQKLPFSQITHFTAIQTILDSLASAEKIHFIDIGKKLGSHWIIIMHALANRKNIRIEQLKITVVCTLKDDVEDTGDLLLSFAESMNLPFVFKILHSEMNELKKHEFELENGEIVAVFLEFCLTSLSFCPKNIEALIEGIKNLNPHVMVVSEVEANTSGSTFIDRFDEAIIICSAMFDCLEDCLERDNKCRVIIEKIYFQEIIKNGVLSEVEEGFKRCRKIDFWREYFARFGIVETELSQASMYQASLLIRESCRWKLCSLSMNGKCMLLGWNGIPLRSLSAWKFSE